jgi:hypothetical protein
MGNLQKWDEMTLQTQVSMEPFEMLGTYNHR